MSAGFRELHFETTGINPYELWRGVGESDGTVGRGENFHAVASAYEFNEA
jgi:hypothetical protein